jgi:hypothetical protein
VDQNTDCPYCHKPDTILHVYIDCIPVQRALARCQDLAKAAFWLQGYYSPEGKPAYYNDFKFLDRFLAFPPCKERTLFNLASTFAIWIAHQHALEHELSAQAYQREISTIFNSIAKKIGVNNYVTIMESKKLFLSFRERQVDDDPPEEEAPSEPPEDPDTPVNAFPSAFDMLPFDPVDLNIGDFILLVAVEEGHTLWLGKVLAIHADLDHVKVWIYGSERMGDLPFWRRWVPTYVDLRDTLGPKWYGTPTDQTDLFYASKWTWEVGLRYARSLPFRKLSRTGRIPATALDYDGD